MIETTLVNGREALLVTDTRVRKILETILVMLIETNEKLLNRRRQWK